MNEGSINYRLVKTSEHLELQFPQDKPLKPLYVDFLKGKQAYRLAHAQGRNELLAKAVGIKKDYRPSVIDCTAGLGRDSLLLAMLGCQVTMLEQNEVLYALVEDGLKRLYQQQPEKQKQLKLTFIHMNAIDYLKGIMSAQQPEVIYLDPMFPSREKSAKIKKEMQVLQNMVGEDKEIDVLFQLALQKARKRVVVKRPLHAKPINTEIKVDLSYQGKSTRFDIYLCRVG